MSSPFDMSPPNGASPPLPGPVGPGGTGGLPGAPGSVVAPPPPSFGAAAGPAVPGTSATPVPPAPPPPEPINITGLLEDDTQGTDEAIQLTRPRPPAIRLQNGDREVIVARVKAFADEAERSRDWDIQARQQRHAKLMQWQTPRHYPWRNATPVSSASIMTAVLRTEDTLQNACITTRPMVNSKALASEDKDRERKLDAHLDYQFFVEQQGEKLIESLSCDFIREGDFVAHVKWVREETESTQRRTFGPIPVGMPPSAYFDQILADQWVGLRRRRPLPDSDGWDWLVWDGEGKEDKGWQKHLVKFYTTEDPVGVEMIIEANLLTFDGPHVERIPYERVLTPVSCENLQAPSPSNPNGASYVILVDYPTRDEVRRLIESGFYDLMKVSDLDETGSSEGTREGRSQRSNADDYERQKLEMRGMQPEQATSRWDARNHDQVLRMVCYDLWAREGEGKSQHVVWTVLDDKHLARSRPLGEVSPGNPVMRPLASAVMIPIPGQRTGIGLPELLEALHDWEVKVKQQMIDAGDIEIQPNFTYRVNSQVNPQTYKIFPGSGMPVTGPQDINWSNIQIRSGPVALNQLGIIKQDREGLSSIGDLQLGKIPAGKSSALRTSGGISQVLQQGEARPERILRRFFMGICDIYRLMHKLNAFYLDKPKAFRAVGPAEPNEDPWQSIDKTDLMGKFRFDFHANVLNSSKVELQNGLQQALGLVMNPLTLQLGMTTPDSAYRLLTDFMRSLGLEPDKYLQPPTPASGAPRHTSAEALGLIMKGIYPPGEPLEPLPDHAAGITSMAPTVAASLTESEQQLLNQYMAALEQKIVAAQQQALLMQSGQSLVPGGQGGGPPDPGANADGQPTLVNANETLDESLPMGTGTPQ